MKKLLSLLIILLPLSVIAQVKQEMEAQNINVSFDHIKHIVFPSQVSDITFGREDYINAERVENAPNIVRLTAVEEDFSGTTNLVIVCTDGNVYSYRVGYLHKGLTDICGNIIYADGNNTSRCYNISSNNSNTAELFFPADVLYLRQGNEEVFNIEYYNNIVKISTSFDKFEPSNLFVVDKDLTTYEITLTNSFSPSYSYNFDDGRKYIARIDVNSIEMDRIISKLQHKKRNIYSVGVIKNKFEMSLANLYVSDDFMFFVFDIKNFSNIDYDIDFVKCFQRDLKKRKNAVQQEVSIDPVLQKDFQKKITGKSDNRFVLVFNKFTIPDDKIFDIEMFEKGGGRHIKLSIRNEYLLSADLLK